MNTIINTERLTITSRNIDEMKQELLLEKSIENRTAFREMIALMKENPFYMDWFCDWSIALSDGTVVGGICLKGPPRDNKRVEIGYEIFDKYQGNGYATEAVSGFCKWIFGNPDVFCICAQTIEGNFCSQKVLIKNGFRRNGYLEEGSCFEKTREDTTDNPLCQTINELTERALWETENLMRCVPASLWGKEYDSVPMWKYIYHTLFSLDRWFINPFDKNYIPPYFHTDDLADLNKSSGNHFISFNNMISYYYTISEKVRSYCQTLTDDCLLTCPEGSGMTRFRLILGQYRHWHRHMGIIYGFIIKDTGNWPFVLNMTGKYPVSKMPNWF
jgi:RimJ/RimL family protein N-acetyltransferase